jgi:hypothetical protein
LAVILLLASQYSFQWFRKDREEQEAEGDSPERIQETEQPTVTEKVEDKELSIFEKHPYLLTPWTSRVPEEFQVGPQVYKPEEPAKEEPVEEHDDEAEEFAKAALSEQAAITKWKAEHPDSNIKLQRRLLEKGIITELPWMAYLTPKADFVDDAAEEAAKWAEEQRTKMIDERPGDYIRADGVGYMENVDGQQVKKTIEGYTQNAEQSDSTLWQRVKKAKGE